MNELRDPYLLLPQYAESLHPVDFKAIGNALSNALKPLATTIGDALVSVCKTIAMVSAFACEAAATLGIVATQAYTKDGAKYGPTSEGMLQWLKEKN